MANEEFQESIKSAIAAHGQWKLRLKQAIAIGRIDVDPDVVALDNKCEFGQWIYGTVLTPDIKASKPYLVIQRLHAEFHVCASKILKLAEAGDIDQAREMMNGDYAVLSQKLMLTLTKWKMEMA